jgi:hypothetical protein
MVILASGALLMTEIQANGATNVAFVLKKIRAKSVKDRQLDKKSLKNVNK